MGPEVFGAFDRGDEGTVRVLRPNANGGNAQLIDCRGDYSAFFALPTIDEDLLRELRHSPYIKEVTRQGDHWRVGFFEDKHRRALCTSPDSPLIARRAYPLEGDVSPSVRWLVDNDARIIRPKRAFFDIETDSRVPFSRKEEMRVLSWAVVGEDSKGSIGVLEADTDRAEDDLLGKFWEAVAPYQQLCAWNGEEFDEPVLRARSGGVHIDFDRWLFLDQLLVFRRMNMHVAESGEEKQSMRLEDIAQAVLKKGKLNEPGLIPSKSLGAQTWEMWSAGGEWRRKLARYNFQDTDLLRQLEAKVGYADLFQAICEACGIGPMTESLQPTRQMDGFMLRLGKERGVKFPTRRRGVEEPDQYKGAYVMQPRGRGILRDVHVCDFKSLYPSIILTWNMSPETKRNISMEGPIPEGVCRVPNSSLGFSTMELGLLPSALLELLRLRKFWSDKKESCTPGTPEWHEANRKSNAYKVAANSFYGLVGSIYSRFYDPAIAEAITQTAVWLLVNTLKEAEDGWKLPAVYGDTDSGFIGGTKGLVTEEKFTEFVEHCNTDVYPKLVKQQQCGSNHIKLAYEKAFDRLVFTAAKRYVGYYSHAAGKRAKADSKPEVKGLEFKRGDTSMLARDLQTQIIDLLRACDDPEAYRMVVEAMQRHVLNDELRLAEIKISKSISKDSLRQYSGGTSVPAHVRVAKILQERGQSVSKGTRIEYIVTNGAESPQHVIPADDYTEGCEDRHHIWETLTYPPSHRLLSAAFPDEMWERYETSRPKQLRGSGRVLEGQTALPFALPPPIVKGPIEEVTVDVPEGLDLRKVKDMAHLHPGDARLVLNLRMAGGVQAEVVTPMRVSKTLIGAVQSLTGAA